MNKKLKDEKKSSINTGESKISVLFISSEASPFAKVGGLADVVGTLPGALCEKGCDARVIMPYYKKIKKNLQGKAKFLRWTIIKLGWRSQYSGLFEYKQDNVTYYFIDNEYFFGNEKIYVEYTFDIERFCFFQRAVLEALGDQMEFFPDILHCNDWQSGMIPCLLKAHYQSQGYFENIKTVFTVHNLKYQGIHSKSMIEDILDLPSEYMNDFGVLFHGDSNLLKAGLVYSDAITTVSKTYAKEILTEEYSEGLKDVLLSRKDDITGIINGIDENEYNPETDSYIAGNYNVSTFSEGKKKCKNSLRKELGLSQRRNAPLIGIITRLVDQKGLDLLIEIIDDLMNIPVQIVILGTGDPYYENSISDFAAKYPKDISACITFDNALAHRIYAGSDIFLMPSLFEPCGLSQMISMKYGTVPVVRETGGLKDTVIPYNMYTGEGTGFSFGNISSDELFYITKMACDLYKSDKTAWEWLIKKGMSTDFSWGNSALKYLELYKSVIER